MQILGQFCTRVKVTPRPPRGSMRPLRATPPMRVPLPVGGIARGAGYAAGTTWVSVCLIVASLPPFLPQGYGMVFRAGAQGGREAPLGVANKASAVAVALPALTIGL